MSVCGHGRSVNEYGIEHDYNIFITFLIAMGSAKYYKDGIRGGCL